MTNEPKTALITGSYGGLGAALAAEHAIRGGDVILSDLNGDRLQEQQKEIAVKYRVHAHTLPADLTKPEEVEQIYNECREHHMHVDYLICNAGFGGQGAFAERSMEKGHGDDRGEYRGDHAAAQALFAGHGKTRRR